MYVLKKKKKRDRLFNRNKFCKVHFPFCANRCASYHAQVHVRYSSWILFRAVFDLSVIASSSRLQTLLRIGFIVQLDVTVRREQTGGRSRGRTRVVRGVGEKGQRSDACDRLLRKRRRHQPRKMEREKNRRINSHLASPSDLVQGKCLRVRCIATPHCAGWERK